MLYWSISCHDTSKLQVYNTPPHLTSRGDYHNQFLMINQVLQSHQNVELLSKLLSIENLSSTRLHIWWGIICGNCYGESRVWVAYCAIELWRHHGMKWINITWCSRYLIYFWQRDKVRKKLTRSDILEELLLIEMIEKGFFFFCGFFIMFHTFFL
jgi:hypothetical protein